jgi:subtilisin family serine protease
MSVAFRHLQDLDLDALRGRWRHSVGVAVLDSGVDCGHPELQDRVVRSAQVVLDGGLFQVVDHPEPVAQDLFAQGGHGTAVAGLILRVAPRARIHDFRVVGVGGVLVEPGALTAALRCAVLSDEVRIINLSIAADASWSREAGLRRWVDEAYRRGKVVVASLGNQRRQGPPVDYPEVLGVHGADLGGYGIRYGPCLTAEFQSWGERVPAPAAGGGEALRGGNSFAAAVASGLAALLLGANPALTPFQVKSLLMNLPLAGQHPDGQPQDAVAPGL